MVRERAFLGCVSQFAGPIIKNVDLEKRDQCMPDNFAKNKQTWREISIRPILPTQLFSSQIYQMFLSYFAKQDLSWIGLSKISRHYFVFVFFLLYIIPYLARGSCKKWQEIINKLGMISQIEQVHNFSSLFCFFFFFCCFFPYLSSISRGIVVKSDKKL